MTKRSVSLHPAALDEALAAAAWYAARSQRASERFLEEVDSIVARVSGNPEQFPAFEAGTRRALLRRFPYMIIFRCTPTELQIVAIAHGRRRPGYWRDRL